MTYLYLQLIEGSNPLAAAFPLLHELTAISDTVAIRIRKGRKEIEVLEENGFSRHELTDQFDLVEYRSNIRGNNIRERGDQILSYLRMKEGFPWHSFFYRKDDKDLLAVHNFGVDLLLGPLKEQKDIDRYIALAGNKYHVRMIEEEELHKVQNDMITMQCSIPMETIERMDAEHEPKKLKNPFKHER